MSRQDLPLLNVFDIEVGDEVRKVLGFLDPVLAGSKGIGPQAVIGDYVTDPEGRFDSDAFRPNPQFVEALSLFMNQQVAGTPEVVEAARQQPGSWLYMVDPRFREGEPGQEPPPGEVLGAFAVDDSGQVVPGSFQYNANHRLFIPDSGVSGIFHDGRFYRWLHGLPEPPARG